MAISLLPGFSRRERAGILTLCIIIFSLIVFLRIMPALYAGQPDEEQAQLQKEWIAFQQQHLEEVPENISVNSEDEILATADNKAFPFDPNTASESQLLDLGLQPRVVRAILNYRARNGKFRTPDEFSKIYTLSEKDFQRLRPYIRIGASFASNYTNNFDQGKYSHPSSAYKEVTEISINAATAEEWEQLYGIGPAYAKRIVEYRNRLGGFLNIGQVKETGIPDSTFRMIEPKLRLQPASVSKLNINTASETELAGHPYIGKKLAANIIMLRNDLKTFSKIEQMRMVPLINEEKYRKIAPYITIN